MLMNRSYRCDVSKNYVVIYKDGHYSSVLVGYYLNPLALRPLS